MKKAYILLFLITLTIPSFSKGNSEKKSDKIAIFIPGVTAGSPIYEELEAGVLKAASEKNIEVKTIEGGFNTALWPEKLKELTATGLYDLIISSNPSMPQIMADISKEFPKQKFLCLDGKIEGYNNIYTAQYKQFDQAYMAGYMAALVTLSDMPGANSDKRVGLVIAHHYPVLDQIIIPGFKKGLSDVDSEITLDIRVVGNWWDATKALELTSLMIKDGADVFLPISGGANQGVITQSQNSGKYVIHFDSNGYNKAPGTVIGSTIIKQKELTYKLVTDYINGALPFGTADEFSAKDGYIDFIEDDKLYQESVPNSIKEEMSKVIKAIKE